MMTRKLTTALALVLSAGVQAQNLTPPEPAEDDPIQAAIRNFNSRTSQGPNEVSVVLPPPPAVAEKTEVASQAKPEQPVLVTGKPPADSSLIQSASLEDASMSPAPPKKGMQIRVATVQEGQGKVDPSNVQLLSPFPAKPLGNAPAGWKIELSDTAPPYTRTVELASGKSIKLTIKPHVLIPDESDDRSYAVSEPGFKTALGFDQDTTVAATLVNSITSLQDDSAQLGHVITQLEQLLVSLPNAEKPVKSDSK